MEKGNTRIIRKEKVDFDQRIPQFSKLTNNKGIYRIQTHSFLPLVLYYTKNSVQCFNTIYSQTVHTNEAQSNCLKIMKFFGRIDQKFCVNTTQFKQSDRPQERSYYAYAQGNSLYIHSVRDENRKQIPILHNLQITDLIVDQSPFGSDLLISIELDKTMKMFRGSKYIANSQKYDVKATQNKGKYYFQECFQPQTIFTAHKHHITSARWYNSLLMSGDDDGMLYIWDINKPKRIESAKKLHYKTIDNIALFTDFCKNNVYLTHSEQEKRVIVSDMRTNQLVRIIHQNRSQANQYEAQKTKVLVSKLGKIILGYSNGIQIIDINSGFKLQGIFTSKGVAEKGRQNSAQLDTPQELKIISSMKFTDLVLDNDKKHIFASDNLGNIHRYNLDTRKCQYALGMCQFGPIRQIQKLNKEVIALDGVGDIYQARLS